MADCYGPPRVKFASGLFIIGACAVSGCSGAPETAGRNRTFYDWSVATGPEGAIDFEQPYARLDFAGAAPVPAYKGVTVLRGGVRLSRPQNWMLRDGGNQPGQAFVQYISPNAYSFAIYERPEYSGELWRDVLSRYEEDAQAAGAKIVGGRVPIASFAGQGRAYTIERRVEAARRPLASRSREYLIRGERRIVLVQIVHEGEDLSALGFELNRVIQTLQVL